MVWGIQASGQRQQPFGTQFLVLLEIPQNLDKAVGVIGERGVPGLETSKTAFVRAFSGAETHHIPASANKRELSGLGTEKKSRHKQGLQEWLDPGTQCHQAMFFFSPISQSCFPPYGCHSQLGSPFMVTLGCFRLPSLQI